MRVALTNANKGLNSQASNAQPSAEDAVLAVAEKAEPTPITTSVNLYVARDLYPDCREFIGIHRSPPSGGPGHFFGDVKYLRRFDL
jgi:hypothetical protein